MTRRWPPKRPAGTRSGPGTTCSRSSDRGSSRSSRAGACWPAWRLITSSVRLGLMVGANTIRNPGHTAKLATTLDHLSGGRAVLGIGGAWFEREHDAFGIPFGSGFGERLDRLDESVMLMRRLLDGERFSHAGQFYTLNDAIVAPRPIQPHLPILVGGLGPAQDAADRRPASRRLEHVGDGRGDRRQARDPGRALRGRRTRHRDDREDHQLPGRPARRCRGGRGGLRPAARSPTASRTCAADLVLLGSPEAVADRIRPYAELGFATVIVRMPAPYDRETIDRMARVAGAPGRVTVVVLAGGTGGAKLAHGLQQVLPAGRPDRRRQHGRRHRATRPARHAGPRRGAVHARRPLRRRARLGDRRRDVDGHGRAGALRRGGLVPARGSRPRDPHRARRAAARRRHAQRRGAAPAGRARASHRRSCR